MSRKGLVLREKDGEEEQPMPPLSSNQIKALANDIWMEEGIHKHRVVEALRKLTRTEIAHTVSLSPQVEIAVSGLIQVHQKGHYSC
jgi:hypothetical protein